MCWLKSTRTLRDSLPLHWKLDIDGSLTLYKTSGPIRFNGLCDDTPLHGGFESERLFWHKLFHIRLARRHALETETNLDGKEK